MKLESLAYYFFGNNVIIGPHIRKQIGYLSDIIPDDFKHREMDDLGCGDGKVTVLLKDIFQPGKLRGFDVDAGLVRRAKSRGIDAEVRDLDADMPSGELAVLWGVLHHLQDCGRCLDSVKQNYPFIFIREPVRSSYFRLLELGHTLRKSEIETMVSEHLPGAQVHYYGNSALIFYTAEGGG